MIWAIRRLSMFTIDEDKPVKCKRQFWWKIDAPLTLHVLKCLGNLLYRLVCGYCWLCVRFQRDRTIYASTSRGFIVLLHLPTDIF